MYRDIRQFAIRLQMLHEERKLPPAVFLGAGASLASGSPGTHQVLTDILLEVGVASPEDLSDGDRIDAFFQMLEGTDEEALYKLVIRYLGQAAPSAGYKHLARLVAEGYFHTLITTNFDTFLEDSLYDAGLRSGDLMVLDAGDGRIPSRSRAPRVRLVKLHGDPYSADFLTRSGEVELSSEMGNLLCELLSGDLLMVGYHPRDKAINQFLEGGDGELWYVHPQQPGVDHPLAPVLADRHVVVVYGEYGYFDRFFGELADLLVYQGVEIQVTQRVGKVHGSMVGVKIGKVGDSVAQVAAPQFQEVEESWSKSGSIVGLKIAALDKEDEAAARIESFRRQLEALEHDYLQLEKEVARYGLNAPQKILNERESVRKEIVRLKEEIDSLRQEEE